VQVRAVLAGNGGAHAAESAGATVAAVFFDGLRPRSCGDLSTEASLAAARDV
jgi:hypothetical protein